MIRGGLDVKISMFTGMAAVAALSVCSAGLTFAATAPMPPMPPKAATINQLHQISVVSSTVDPKNGDTNPYAVAISPSGDLYVSNFSNSAGINGKGTTIEKIVNGQPNTFFSGADGPAAMAFSPKGPLWIANFGQQGSDGDVQVILPNGQAFPGTDGIITNAAISGPWGQTFTPGYTSKSGVKTPAAFFVASALNGSIEALSGFSPPTFDSDTTVTVIGQGLAHTGNNANDIVGPQGMAWSSTTDTLYVVDGADNSIRAFKWWGTSTPDQGQGTLIYQGAPLNQPAGLAIDPLNGDLLVVNQGNNNLVELALQPQGPTLPTPPPMMGSGMGPMQPPAPMPGPTPPQAHVVGQQALDTGAPGALFGLAATTDSQGNLVVYYTDDNTNTLNRLGV